MEKITKTYSISNWVEYTEDFLGDTTGMSVETFDTILSTHPATVTTWLDDQGNGYEKREFLV